ncbi:MAG: GNAT family N-acetyltransferase [Candidatus Helarchaeota archaeon]
MVEIVPYDSNNDYEKVKELMEELTKFWGQSFNVEQFNASLSRRTNDPVNKEGILLAKEGNEVLGMIWCEVVFQPSIGTYGRISNFVVRKEARGKGIGKKLIESAIKFFVENNVSRVQANARNLDKEGRLYSKYGFKPLYFVLETKLDMEYFTKSY